MEGGEMKRLEPTYNSFPSLPWEIGMPEMVDAYEEARKQPWYTNEDALCHASLIYNSERDHYLRGLWSLPLGGASRERYEHRKLAEARKHLERLTKAAEEV